MALVNHTIAPSRAGEDTGTAEFGDNQLDYSLSTVPHPLTVSPESTVELADLIITGSHIQNTEIETNQIAVYLPIGSEAWQLLLDYTGIQARMLPTGWSATPDPDNERILFKPDSGTATINPQQGITIHLDNLRINRQVGTAPILIALNWRATGSSGAYRTEEQTLAVGKFPAGFYLRDLKADSDYINNGDAVTLTWECSDNAAYTLLYEDKSIDVTKYSTYTIHNITRSTMFYLEGATQQGTGSATLRLNTYITVHKPDAEVGNLTVGGSVQMLGQQSAILPDTDKFFSPSPETDGILHIEMYSGNLAFNVTGSLQHVRTGERTLVPIYRGQEIYFKWHSQTRSVKSLWIHFGSSGPLEFK
ncbi:hypothetical protein ACFVOK_14170 [Streptomyces sp. NPDC057798]|uniref:hypothetical protein n=1 Tax=Streptomyces sp. NPDC057798 TaxID=3346252 RepID=UPI0036BBBF8A